MLKGHGDTVVVIALVLVSSMASIRMLYLSRCEMKTMKGNYWWDLLFSRTVPQSFDKEVIGFLFTCVVCTPEEKCVSLCCCTQRVVLAIALLVLNLSAVWSVTGWVSVKWSSHAVAVVTVGLMIPCKLTCWCGEQTPLFSLDCLLQTVFKGAIYKF